MEVIYCSNEFPRDDLEALLRHLYNHSKDRRHPILAQFITEATRAIRDEVKRLPKALQELIPPFGTILDWADNTALREGVLCGSVDGVLLCVVQLATYIGHAETHPDELFNFPNTCLTGLGIGLLSSTAIALSPTLAELPLAGVDAVCLAFRMGVLVSEISADLEARDPNEAPDTWAFVVHNVVPDDAQRELDAFRVRESLPETGKVFVSAISRTSVTVSGPPSRLKDMFKKSAFFRDARSIALPVFGGLCHASHVYNRSHAQSIVGGTTLRSVESKRCFPMMHIYSTGNGKPLPARDCTDLLENVILELLTQPIIWDNVISGIVERATATGSSSCTAYCFRNSIPIKELAETLTDRVTGFETSTYDLMPWVSDMIPKEVSPRGPAQSKIAIVGMSCRLPGGATDTEKFWEILEKGLDVHRKIPADRFDVETHCDPTGKRVNSSPTSYGCFIDEPGLFDAPFFNMSPREAQQTDPMMRLALVTAYEALERAGYVANRTTATNLHRIGTFYGQASDDYREVNSAQEISTYFIPGGCRAFGPGRINYFFKFSGPSYSIDTACSSSLATIQTACTALWAGAVDTVVAGGTNVLTNSDAFAGLGNGHFLTKTPNACKTWDSEADGYCRADGIGSIVMKRLEDAEADNDNILGVILGAGTNHSAEAVSITHPHAPSQAYLYREVLARAGVDPLDVNFVEMHGTGTQAGDIQEIKSITDVFAPASGTKRRSKDQPLHIGAVKSNIGHGEAVAGVTAMLKVLVMLQKGAIPPHVGIKHSINPGFPTDFDKRNLRIPFEKTPWPQVAGRKRIAAINNFSAAGGNTTVVLEEAPERTTPTQRDPRPTHVVAISAKNKVSLDGNLRRLQAYLDANPDVSLADLSYTTTARRYHHNNRVAVSISDVNHLKKHLASRLAAVDSHQPVSKSGPPPITFVFTGQGASYKSMNLELFHDVPSFNATMRDLDSLAQRQGFPSFIPAIDGSHPQDQAHSPVVTQLALVCTEIGLAKYWASLGVKPDLVMGHSLGEYAAMHVAGVLSASDTICLVGRRAELLEQKCRTGSHQMMAVRASLAQINENAGGRTFTVACINGPQDTVLSGTGEQMNSVAESLQAAGYRCIKIDVAFAFHSEQTDPILDEFEAIAKTGVLFKAPTIPVISPLHGKVIFDDKTLTANYVRRATRETVNFLAALESARDISVITDETVWVEIGPHPVCCGFVKSSIPSTTVAVPSLRRGETNWTTMTQGLAALHLAGVEIGWNEFHGPFERQLRLLDLPTYAWSEKTYWIPYNGDWALTKGNTFYDAEKEAARVQTGPAPRLVASSIKTSTVQQIVEETFQDASGTVVMESDLMQPDFLAAAHGHRMNGCGVVTSSIHADIAFTLGEHLYQKLTPGAKSVDMNLANLLVSKGLVANQDTTKPQLMRVTASTANIHSKVASLHWQNVAADGQAGDIFATASIHYGDAAEWRNSWIPVTHLVQGRIDALEQMAKEGKANRLSHNMAYTLFANNLVDYADKYRGMQTVTIHELEAFADVQLTTEKGGTWTIPPYFIDSVAHLAGFVMNCSDVIDTQKNYCVTPGWESMRFACPLVPGAKYRSYVKMIPTVEDATVYFGDVYILQNDLIMGMVGGIQFRRYPRILLNRFFSPPDKAEASSKPKVAATAASASTVRKVPAPASAPAPPVAAQPESEPVHAVQPTVHHDSGLGREAPELVGSAEDAQAKSSAVVASTAPSSVANSALMLIANEAALELSDLEDDSSFAALGVDSLMSLVISEKFRSELDIKVGGSLFLDYPTIGDLRAWLEEYYN